MPKDITAFIMLESIDSNGFGGGRDITHIISLDEGHDRFYWEWVKHPQIRKFERSSVWIPEGPETALRDGLLMLIADGLGDESLQAQIPYEAGCQGRVDLNRSEPLGNQIFEQIALALERHKVHLMTFSDSCVRDQPLAGAINLTRRDVGIGQDSTWCH